MLDDSITHSYKNKDIIGPTIYLNILALFLIPHHIQIIDKPGTKQSFLSENQAESYLISQGSIAIHFPIS